MQKLNKNQLIKNIWIGPQKNTMEINCYKKLH